MECGVEVGKSVKGCEQPKVPFHVVQCGAELSACSRVLVTNGLVEGIVLGPSSLACVAPVRELEGPEGFGP